MQYRSEEVAARFDVLAEWIRPNVFHATVASSIAYCIAVRWRSRLAQAVDVLWRLTG